MTASRDEFISYCCEREGTSEPARYRYRGTRDARPADPDSLEFFVFERYYLYSVRGDSLVRAQMSHAPYRFREADVSEWSATPVHLDGFSEISDEPAHICFVDGVDVKVFGTAPARD